VPTAANNKQYQEGEKLLLKIIKEKTGWAEPLLLQAKFKQAQQQWNELPDIVNKFLTVEPSAENLEIAIELLQQCKQLAQATEHAERLVLRKTKEPKILILAAKLQKNQGNEERYRDLEEKAKALENT